MKRHLEDSIIFIITFALASKLLQFEIVALLVLHHFFKVYCLLFYGYFRFIFGISKTVNVP